LANHKSALKRARQNEIRHLRNKSDKSKIKGLIKEVRLAVDDNAAESAAGKLNTVKSAIDKAAKKGVIHKKTAARKVSRLTKLINSVNA
jgi:small subunit ribosomal protein S20